MARATLHTLLIAILRDHDHYSRIAKQKRLITWRVRRTVDWLERQIYESDVRLDTLAASFGLSPSGLRMRFQAETGYTPKQYLLHRRIEEARRRLSVADDHITAIAHELGFPLQPVFRHRLYAANGKHTEGLPGESSQGIVWELGLACGAASARPLRG